MSVTRRLFEHDLGFFGVIGGCDEAGRGSLAGPLVCACCIMPLDSMIDGVNDSKKLSENKRELLFERIIECAIAYKVLAIDHETIDKINILNATKLGMREVVSGLPKTDLVLIDAVKTDFDRKVLSIIKGDSLSYNIACASIIAKVTRDRLMRECDKSYSGFNFAKNKGYGTREHIEAIFRLGACKIHRKTYLKNLNYGIMSGGGEVE